jgi:hypothetical protein
MKSPLLDSLVAVALLALLACGCTTHELSRNIYEGIKTHEDSLKSTPLEKPGTASPSYEEYERERRSLSPRNAE